MDGRSLLVGLLVLVVAGCAASPASSPSPATGEQLFPPVTLAEDATASERVIARVGAAGEPTLQDALDLFAIAFSPLPGTERPAGPIEPLHDGTLAVGWLRHFWAELTLEQQAYAESLINGEVPQAVRARWAVAAAGPAGPLAPTRQRRTADALPVDWDTLAPAVRDEIAALIGRPLGAELITVPLTEVLQVPPEQLWNSTAWAWALNADGLFEGEPALCTIHIQPGYHTVDAAFARYLMAHEVFHCFHFTNGPLETWHNDPAWVTEGAAEWAGFTLSPEAWNVMPGWRDYLQDPTLPLFARSYDAHGIYTLLDNSGVSPWTVMDDLLTAARNGTVGAYEFISQTGADPFLDTWGSRYFMYDTVQLGNWRYVAAGLTSNEMYFPVPVWEVTPSSSYTVSADVWAAHVALGQLKSDVVVLEGPGGHGRVAFRATDTTLADAYSLPICTVEGGCVCPDDSAGAGTLFRDLPFDSLFAAGITGHFAGNGLSAFGLSLADFCQREPKGTPTAQPIEPPDPGGGRRDCGSGCAGSNGDPHLTTVDGQLYDFQAAGEFTLLRSADGTFEVQARQEPYQDSRLVAINTAIAIGYDGARVAAYATADGMRLLVDGTEVSSTETSTAGELTVNPSVDRLEVSAPDGTTVWLIGVGDHGINLLIAPSEELDSSGVGLLGPVGEDVLPALPDGSRVATEDRFRDAVYVDLAAGWEVSAETSLFDYEAGAGPQTYRDPTMPLPDAPLSFADLTPEQQQVGLAACVSVADGALREQCAFDMAVTGDEAFLAQYQQTETLVALLGGDACRLLSDEEILTATESPVIAMEPTAERGSAGCTWDLDNGPDYEEPWHVTVDVYWPGGAEEFRLYQNFGSPELIEGFDGEVYDGSFDDILILRGDMLVAISYESLFVRQEILEALARAVLERL